jgi:ABC-type uncharacterized transport system ATPase subunit
VVIASADLDELITLADRLLVTFEGRIREVARDRNEAGRAMLGLDTEGYVRALDHGMK